MNLASARINEVGNNLHVSYGDDKGLLVEFVEDAIYQPKESEEKGRAIYKTCPFVSIIFPGDKTKAIYRPASLEDKQRFPVQWQAFEKGGAAIENGTPVTEWNYLSKSQALELKHMGFWTVELLANASDMTISGLMGGTLLREQAKAFIASTKDDSKYTALVAENETLKLKTKEQGETISSLAARIDALEKPKHKGEK